MRYLLLLCVCVCVCSDDTLQRHDRRISTDGSSSRGRRVGLGQPRVQEHCPEIAPTTQTIWMIGPNSTMVKCIGYTESGQIPILTAEDQEKLGKLIEEANNKQNSRGNSKTGSKSDSISPIRFIVCDMESSSTTGMVWTTLETPFMVMGPKEVTNFFRNSTYVPYPCGSTDSFKDKITHWGSIQQKLFSTAFSGKLSSQVRFDDMTTIFVIVFTGLLCVVTLIWIVVIVIRCKKKNTLVPLVVKQTTSKYPQTSYSPTDTTMIPLKHSMYGHGKGIQLTSFGQKHTDTGDEYAGYRELE